MVNASTFTHKKIIGIQTYQWFVAELVARISNGSSQHFSRRTHSPSMAHIVLNSTSCRVSSKKTSIYQLIHATISNPTFH